MPFPSDAESSNFGPSDPVRRIPTDKADEKPQPGIGLCLSGGGYRAMLFHVGVLWRLNEFGYLTKLDRVSSVSGGSITAGVLALNWKNLTFDQNAVAANFRAMLVEPVRGLAGRTIDAISIIGGVFGPGSVADKVANAYRKHLFDKATLQDLPDKPRFVINATNVQSKVLWRFSKPYMADYRVGKQNNPKIELAVAVAASSAFPPVLSPLELDLRESDFEPKSGMDLQFPPYTTEVVLTDGGVYDNLGLETVWKNYETVLVSDGGGVYGPDPDPKRDWIGHTKRVMDLIDNQVRSLRKRQVIDSFKSVPPARRGAYWGAWTDIKNYAVADALSCPVEKTAKLAGTPTRLKALESEIQERLINWGYAVCDAAMRRHVDPKLSKPTGFPYPGGVG